MGADQSENDQYADIINLEDQDLHWFSSEIISYFKKGIKNLKAHNIFSDHFYTEPEVVMDDLKNHFRKITVPEVPQSMTEYYEEMYDSVLPFTINTASSHFIGHMTSVLPSFVTDLTRIMTLLNQNTVKIETSKSFTLLERQTLGMLHHLFYHESSKFYDVHTQNSMSTLGVVVSGGTLANITALWVARNRYLKPDKNFKGVSEEGMKAALDYYKYEKSIILISPLAHYSFTKAASVLGIGKKNIYYIPLNSKGMIDLQKLQMMITECKSKKIHILAIVGIAGATETGEIDPLVDLGNIAKKYNIHFHVDAAFGGALIFSDQYKHLLNGINFADSITICGHKQLYLSMGISVCLFKDPNVAQMIYHTADYQATIDSFDFGKVTLEGSRPASSLLLHAGLHLIAKKGYAALIATSMKNTIFLKNTILDNHSFELLIEPKINIVNYRYVPKKFREKLKLGYLTNEDNCEIDQANLLLQKIQFIRGKTFVSKTKIPSRLYQNEIVTLRVIFMNPLLTTEDILCVLQDQLEIAAKYIELSDVPEVIVF